MRFIRTGNDDKDGSKTFINLENITKIDFYPKVSWPYNHGRIRLETYSGLSFYIEEGEIGYEEIKKLVIS